MYGLLLIGVGVVDLFYSWKFLTDPNFAKQYIQKNPKALIWRKMLGEKNAIKLTKTVFAPIGLVLGILLLLGGIVSLQS